MASPGDNQSSLAAFGDKTSPSALSSTATSYDLHPDCSICRELVENPQAHRYTVSIQGEDGPLQGEDGTIEGGAFKLFHTPCDSCPDEELTCTELCRFCCHLRLRHLSLCVSSQQFPLEIQARKPDPDSTCPLCQFFLRVSCREYLPKKRNSTLEFPLYLYTTEWHAQQVQWRVTGPDFFSTPAQFLIVQDDEIPIPVLGNLFSPGLDYMRSAISQCLDNHKSCNGPANTLLPHNFRLVDVERRCIVALADTADKPYIALSYVWGESNNADWSTKMNIDERLVALDITVLPATIRDAIAACEQLGERYIWIDRLCILQDDERDKMSQVHSMASIYTGAKFVIIDASSNGINDGIAGISRVRKTQISESLAGLNINIQLPPLWDVVGPTSWNSRGWTYQEAILPLRKIYFTQSQVFYECALRIDHEETLAYSSFDPSMHDKVNYPTTTTSLCYGAVGHCCDELEKTQLSSRYTAEKPWDAYARHLPRYRQRLLRQSSDLLNAFSGIMDALYPGGSSYYGLPTSDIDMALIWRKWNDPYVRKVPLTGNPEIRGDDPGLFPSWSWASATEVIVDYADSNDFCGSLCLWFQPDTIGRQLQPILASSQAAGRWIRTSTTRTSDSLRERADDHKLWIKLLADHVLLSPVCANATAWGLGSSSDVTEELTQRWPSYEAFWQDVHGQENHMRDMQTLLNEEVLDRIRDGVLVTRAQICSVEVRKVLTLPTDWPGSRQGRPLAVYNCHGREIGYVYDDCNERIKDFLHEEIGTFECAALSVSAREVRIKEDSVQKDERNEAENTFQSGGVGSEGNENRGESKVRSIPTYRWEVQHWANVLIIHKDNGYCYRIGLGEVKMDDWLELPKRMETIILG